jgi:hypothetical protein
VVGLGQEEEDKQMKIGRTSAPDLGQQPPSLAVITAPLGLLLLLNV